MSFCPQNMFTVVLRTLCCTTVKSISPCSGPNSPFSGNLLPTGHIKNKSLWASWPGEFWASGKNDFRAAITKGFWAGVNGPKLGHASKLRVMIVDDEKLARDFLIRMLSKLEDIHEIIACATTGEARERIGQFRLESSIFWTSKCPENQAFNYWNRCPLWISPLSCSQQPTRNLPRRHSTYKPATTC